MKVSGLLHTAAALTLGNNPATHWIGDWAGLGGLHNMSGCCEEKSLAPTGIRNTAVPARSPVAILTAFPHLPNVCCRIKLQVMSSFVVVLEIIPSLASRFSARPDRPWGPPSLLYNGYRVFPGGKVRPGRAADHSPSSSAAVLEELSYTSTHPLGHRRACNGNTLPLPLLSLAYRMKVVHSYHSTVSLEDHSINFIISFTSGRP